MNWRRIFAVMKVRIGMIAVVLLAFMLIRAGTLMGQEVKAENTVLNADSEMPQEEAWGTVGAEEEVKVKSRPRERTPVRYTGEYSAVMGILDSENTIFYQDFYKDYLFPYPKGINYFITICPQDSLEGYFNHAYLYASGEPSSELNRKDIYCMFYDDRTCNMGKEELEVLFLQNGYELSICEGECKGYQVRFYQYGIKDSDRWLYPRHIIMQTWDGGNVYVQDITSIMQRKVMNFISVEDRENPIIIVHSTAMTRAGIPEEELLFWGFDGNCWSLVPLELEIECFMKTSRGELEPGRIEDFNPIYYKDGITFRTAVYVEDEYEIVSFQIADMRIQEEQGEEKTPLMSGEEFDKITECLDEQVPEIWNEWADHSAVWAYFYVSEDFSEVLWCDLVQGMDSEYPVLNLDEWRNSDFYPKLEK